MLRKPCDHDRYEYHGLNPEGIPPSYRTFCPGGSNATIDDLIAALREQGAEGIVQIRYVGPEQAPFYVDEALV